MARSHVAVVGAGITGLVAAHRLRQFGVNVSVVEAADAVGGRIQSERRDGYVLERGPHTILERNPATARLIEELGLDSELVEADEEANRRYVVRDGEPRPVPMGPGEFLDSELLSTEAKLRLLLEPFVPARRDDVDESLGNFVRRRLGEEVLDYAVGPIIGGIYAGQPRLLSARYAFDTAWQMEQTHGSMAAGGVYRLLERLVGDNAAEPEGRLVSFEGGSARLVERLADRLDGRIEYGTRIERLERESPDDPGDRDTWHLVDAAGDVVGDDFDAVLWTGPAYELADLDLCGPSGRDERTEAFEEIDYPPVTIVAMGVDRDAVDHPLDGFGMLVPEPEPHPILGTLFMSSVFSNRAPAGCVLLSTFVGGAREPDMARASEDELVECVRSELDMLIGLRAEPELVDVYRWERAIPQYEVGYGRMLDRMEALEADHRGLFLAGSFRDGVAVPDLIETGEAMAEAIR